MAVVAAGGKIDDNGLTKYRNYCRGTKSTSASGC